MVGGNQRADEMKGSAFNLERAVDRHFRTENRRLFLRDGREFTETGSPQFSHPADTKITELAPAQSQVDYASNLIGAANG